MLGARDAVLQRLQNRSKVKRAWVVFGGARRAEREEVGARFKKSKLVLLELPAQACVARIEEKGRNPHLPWRRWVHKWWEVYQA